MKYTLNPNEYYKIDNEGLFDGLSYVKINSKEEIFDGGVCINKNYDKIVLLAYTYSSGGNFLINCLSLSDDVCSSFNSVKDKEKYFYDKLGSQELYWVDFTINNQKYTYNDIELNNKEKYFFISTHIVEDKDESKSLVDYHLYHLKNCKIIYFINPNLFCELRRCVHNYKKISNFSKFNSLNHITLDNYFNLSEFEKNKLKNKYNDKKKYSYCDIKTKKEIYIWDVNCFLSENDFLYLIKQFYDGFCLSGFDEELLRNFYKAWIGKLCELRNIQIPKRYNPWIAFMPSLYAEHKIHDIKVDNMYQNFNFNVSSNNSIIFLTDFDYDYNIIVNCLSLSNHVSSSKTNRFEELIDNIENKNFFLNNSFSKDKWHFVVDYLWTFNTLKIHKKYWKNSKIIICSEKKYNTYNYYDWNPKFYLTSKDFLLNIKKLYDFLGFDDYDENSIRACYNIWVKKNNDDDNKKRR